jgi:uncharacterized membrane protein YhaH (DUF805 family)
MLLVSWWKVVVLRKYAQFAGRAGRAEFWWFELSSVVIITVLSALAYVSVVFTVLGGIYALAVLVPGIAVGVRRLHDTGRSGWWLLLFLVPLVGFVVLLVFFVSQGNPGPNQYGPPAASEPVLA